MASQDYDEYEMASHMCLRSTQLNMLATNRMINQDNLFKAPSKVHLSVDSRADKILEVGRGHLVQCTRPQNWGL